MSLNSKLLDANNATDWSVLKNALRQRALKCMANCRILGAMVILVVMLLSLVLCGLFMPPADSNLGMSMFALLALGTFASIALAVTLLWRDYIHPLLEIETWVLGMRSGELTSKVPVPRHGQIAELAVDLNDFGTMMDNLSRDTEQQLVKYTEYTEQKTLSLTILYDVASSINSSRNLSELLERFLLTLTRVIRASAGAVRLVNKEDQMELVASIGFDDKMIAQEKIMPAASCACGLGGDYDGFLYQQSLLPCQQQVDHPFFQQNLGLIVVPLQYQGQTLGVFNLFIEEQYYQDNGDYKELFTSIGKHLGMAIAKARLDEESNKLSIIQERNRLSYELHDSLAQTLTSIRYQVRILDDFLHQQDESGCWQQLERIENTVEEANTELRSLIAHFQAPISNREFIESVKDMVNHFRSESDIPIFFQHTIEKPLQFTDRVHLEVTRIMQEAMNNIRKHSEAKVARVMVRMLRNRKVQILIEDDGIGLQASTHDALPGEQIGLKSMRERAARIKAAFSLESEAGEGVRLILEIDQEDITPEDVVSIDTRFNL